MGTKADVAPSEPGHRTRWLFEIGLAAGLLVKGLL